MDKDSKFLLFSGRSHPSFAKEVANHLGVSLGEIHLGHFPDKEIEVEVLESVRGKEVFVVQTIALEPNEFLMELLIIVDALKRASAHSITAVVPYFGYCRQDRKDRSRVPITAKLVANMLEKAGVDRLITMDLHAGQLQGFFDIPVNHLRALPLMEAAIRKLEITDLVVVGPDAGSAKLARDYANQLNLDYALIDKVRSSASNVTITAVIGDIKGKNVLLADDVCSTGGTLVSAAKACREKGALSVTACATHPMFVGDALNRVNDNAIDALLISDTIPLSAPFEESSKIHLVSVASDFARAIERVISAET